MEPDLLKGDVLEKVISHPAGCRHSVIIVLTVRDVGVECLACMVAYVNPCLNSVESQLTEQDIKMSPSSQGQMVLCVGCFLWNVWQAARQDLIRGR